MWKNNDYDIVFTLMLLMYPGKGDERDAPTTYNPNKSLNLIRIKLGLNNMLYYFKIPLPKLYSRAA